MYKFIGQLIEPPDFLEDSLTNRVIRYFYVAAEIFLFVSLILLIFYPRPDSVYFWLMFIVDILFVAGMASFKHAQKGINERQLSTVELKDLRQQTDYLTALHETALSLVNRLEQGPLLESILTRACEIMDTPHGFLELVTPDGLQLKQEIGLGMFQQFSGSLTPKGEGITGRVWASGEPLVIEDYWTWEYRRPNFEQVGFHAGLAIPLISDGEVIGAFGMAYTEVGRVFTPAQVELMQRFAALASLAIKNTRLYQAAQAEIEERKLVANALRQSEDRLNAVINHIPFDLWVCDAAGRYVMQNTASAKVAFDVIGKTALELDAIPQAWRERWHHENQIALSGRVFTSEPVEENVSGISKHYIITTAPIFSDGAIIGLVGMSVDVTELKNAEDKYRQLNIELEQRVIERTAQLEAANTELEAFTYSVSHDLRAPLRSITGYTRILMVDFAAQISPEAMDFIAKVHKSGQRMGNLIDDLLAFSRLGRTPLHCAPVALADLAQMVFSELSHGEDNGRVITFSVGALPTVNADYAMLKQVFANLIGNAIKYSRPREVAEIEIGSFQENGRDVIFIRDNGVGFDMRYIDKLFGVFQRLHSASEFEGTGVGLALVQRIIHRHGGEIWANSELDKGTTFFFTINM